MPIRLFDRNEGRILTHFAHSPFNFRYKCLRNVGAYLKIHLFMSGRSTKATNEDPVIACVGGRTHHVIENLDATLVSIFIYSLWII